MSFSAVVVLIHVSDYIVTVSNKAQSRSRSTQSYLLSDIIKYIIVFLEYFIVK